MRGARNGMAAIAVSGAPANAAARTEAVRAILVQFGIAQGGTVSGVAAGGRFLEPANGPLLETSDPTTGTLLARVQTASEADYRAASEAARTAFLRWRT